MIRWSKEQLLRPAKHLCNMPGASGSSSGSRNTVCLQCKAPIPSWKDIGLCAKCRRTDIVGRTAEKVARRKKHDKYRLVGGFNPDKPNCGFCVNYKDHLCAFGFPEAIESRTFAQDCYCFQPMPGLVEPSETGRHSRTDRPGRSCGACNSCSRSQTAGQG